MKRNRGAAIAFLAVSVSAVVWMLVLTRHRWFFSDEWDFLSLRTAWNVNDLFRPHSEHWSTLPILTYRLLWQIVGLRSYVPYMALAIILHTAVAAVLRAIMRQSGVNAWVATALAGLYVIFGTGWQDTTWAFQIGVAATLLFGFLQLWLVNHDGPVDRRDLWAVVAGLAALMCTGIAVTLVLVVGLALVLRRRYKVALLNTMPLGIIYLVWYAAIGHEDAYPHRAGFGDITRYAARGLDGTLHGLSQVPHGSLAVAALIIVGMVVAAHRTDLPGVAAPLALACGAVVFFAITGAGRAILAQQPQSQFAPTESRFLDIAAAFLLVPLAVAVGALIREKPLLIPAFVACLAISAIGNVRTFNAHAHANESVLQDTRRTVLALPHIEAARTYPADLVPEQTYLLFQVHLGWLRSAAHQGRLPDPGPISPSLQAKLTQDMRRSYMFYLRRHA